MIINAEVTWFNGTMILVKVPRVHDKALKLVRVGQEKVIVVPRESCLANVLSLGLVTDKFMFFKIKL